MKCLKMSVIALLVSMVLACTIGSAYFTGYRVQASGVLEMVGGSALFDFMLGLFGVSTVTGAAGEPEWYDEYLAYLDAGGDPNAFVPLYQDLQLSGNDTVRITPDMLDSVQEFLQGKVGDLSSGHTQVVYDGNYYNHNYTFDALGSSFYDFITSNYKYYLITNEYDGYYYLNSIVRTLDTNQYLVAYYDSYDSVPRYYVYVVTYDQYGLPTSSSKLSFFKYSLVNSVWKQPAGTSSRGDLVDPFGLGFVTNMPVIFVDSKISVNNLPLSEVLAMASVVPQRATVGVSFGSYSQVVMDSIKDKSITALTINKANTAVSDAITANTVTDADTGAITYTDAIAKAVSDAITKALTDTGVIDKPTTGEGEGEGDKDLPIAGDILSVLTDFRDAALDWFGDVKDWIMDIPQTLEDGFANVAGWLEGVWDAVIALPDAIAEKIQAIIGPGDTTEPPDNNTFTADLITLFPFCIPFDLIACFELFNAEPETPYLEIPIHFDYIDYDYTFEFSLADFEPVAVVCRITFMITYMVGLILATRNLIRG